MQVNLFPFVIEALGNNKKIYKDIDKLYQTKKYEFYKAAKEHELYNHQIIREGSLVQEEYCKKILGLLTGAGEDEEVYMELDKIIRKGYRWTYIYVKNHSTIKISSYISSFFKKHKGSVDFNGVSVDFHLIIMIFLSLNNQRELIQDDEYNNFLNILMLRLEHYSDKEDTRLSLEKATEEEKGAIKKLKQSLYKKYGSIKNFDDILKGEYELEGLEQCAFLFDFEKISSISIFEDVKFTENDIDSILYLYVISKSDQEELKEVLKYLISYMYILYLIKAYKQVKQMYFKNNKETMFIELEGLEKSLNSATEKLFIAKQELSKSEEKLIALEKENARLKAELSEEKKNREELNSLREFLFNLDKKEDYIDERVSLDILNNYKAVIIGGHDKWQQRMKEILSNFIFIHPDNLNFDIKILDDIDIVFIYVNYLNHGLYYRVMSAIEGKDIKVAYINQQNEELVLQTIYYNIIKHNRQV